MMARKYQLKQRAERQQETRQRIVEAAVALHTSLGPARTSVSAIAERAGVQRHTFYRHFPDERSLNLACSGLYYEHHPLPDPGAWRSIADPERRLRRGLGELYSYYERNVEALGPIVRDAEIHPLTQEILAMRLLRPFEEIRAVLAEPFQAQGQARQRLLGMLGVFMNFAVWRVLRTCVPSRSEAIEAAVRAVRSQ